ncbi:hypothetical protein SAMN06265370_11748 [Puniceibacterium sediminis]|uniref:Uncharacterized protein n=1 Tax=Puniceibacterium sediminis TaxID=1608407 RepID=A0A238YHS8_9RHOB|nr:hypothetical protein SAMN06265370_11748 [Puniceibacterium sediminis]
MDRPALVPGGLFLRQHYCRKIRVAQINRFGIEPGNDTANLALCPRLG